MLKWLKTYWPALAVSAAGLAVLDAMISSLLTCHPITDQASGGTNHQETKEYCTALHGPILVSIRWIAHIAHQYEGLITAAFTIVLAAFTARLWWSTDKLWIVATETAKAQSDETKIIQRAYLGTIPRKLHEMVDDETTIAYIAIINAGNLPARNVRNNVKIGWFEDGNKKDFEKVEVEEEGAVLILPKTEIERGTPNLSTGDEINYRARIGYIYVWGRVEYNDGFKDGRWLIFCHRYNCRKAETPRLHHHHNDGN